MKFAFSLSTVVEADSQETALGLVASHIGRVAPDKYAPPAQ